MNNFNKSVTKVSVGPLTKPATFTFVPVLQKLPIKGILTEEERSESLTGDSDQNIALSRKRTTRETMSDGQIFKAKIVFIKDILEGHTAEPNLKSPHDHVSLSLTRASPSVNAWSKNTPSHLTKGTVPMETAVDKQRGISRQKSHDISRHAEVRKIKSSYKSLAAIPTNTLLLEQQVIDEQVEKEQSPHDTLNRCVKDTHAEMCSPAQLRQQSEELYAVIDEILANSIPATSTSPITKTGFQQRNSSFPKSLGRETKYASLCSLHPSTGKEKKLMDPKKTKPGIIRPNTAIPSLTGKVEDKFNPNSFQQLLKQTLIEKKKRENTSLEEGQRDLYAGSSEKTLNEERMPERGSPFSVCELHIKEPGEDINHLSKEAPTSFSTTEKHMEAFETHI
ncbi:muscular LMNA-interacting protein isoform X3 [Melanotaenia boesemani]|uniref:muscular LMNA-interacting protein isoform X3 n=1 Tax=Melanotaenia boesemani TaxID=1250792 RepID=UPI001C0443DB|nr:muscular LMNA-interacting protein isoform X3 [Melanotaenia boesemani]